jgi:hypothetical protein
MRLKIDISKFVLSLNLGYRCSEFPCTIGELAALRSTFGLKSWGGIQRNDFLVINRKEQV